MKERRKGTYVACKYSKESTDLLYHWANIWNVPNQVPEKDLHSTILYSRVPLATCDYVNHDYHSMAQLGWRFLPTEVKALASKSGPRALILLIEASELQTLHKEFLSKGATHDYPSLMTHVTISYNLPEDFDVTKMVPPPVYLIPTKIYTEPLDCDWTA